MPERYFPLHPLTEEEVLAVLVEEEPPEPKAQAQAPEPSPAQAPRVWTYDEMYDAIRADSEYLIAAWQKFPGGKGVDTKKLLEAVNAGKYPAPTRKE